MSLCYFFLFKSFLREYFHFVILYGGLCCELMQIITIIICISITERNQNDGLKDYRQVNKMLNG